MPIYIQLLTLTPEGKQRVLQDPESITHVHEDIRVPEVQVLGQYAVLGQYDYVNIVQARDNESMALFSLYLGVKVGAHIATMPTIPISRFEDLEEKDRPTLETGATVNGEGQRIAMGSGE